MIQRLIFGLAALCVAASPSVDAAAKGVTTLPPSGPWNINYAVDSCQLLRVFGKNEDEITLRIERFAPGPIFALSLAGKRLGSEGLYTPIRLMFGPGGKFQREDALSGTTGKAKLPMLVISSVSLAQPAHASDNPSEELGPEQEKAVQELTIDQSAGRNDYLLQLGSMASPMSQMRKCTDELLTHWGIDADARHTRSREATPLSDPRKWLRSSDYPAEALNQGASASIRFRLIVDPEGGVSKCSVQAATAGPSFAEITCPLLIKRARFKPALDAQGQPIASYYVSVVNWLMAQ